MLNLLLTVTEMKWNNTEDNLKLENGEEKSKREK